MTLVFGKIAELRFGCLSHMRFCDFAIGLMLDELIVGVVLGPLRQLGACYSSRSTMLGNFSGNDHSSRQPSTVWDLPPTINTAIESHAAFSSRSSSGCRPRILKIDCINFRSARLESGLAKLYILTQYSSKDLTMMQLSAANKTVVHRQRKKTFLNKPSSSASTTQASTAASCNRARSHSDPPPDTNTSTYTH